MPILRPALLLCAAGLTLAACATPREACINRVRSDLRTLDRLAAETRGNVERGFAYRTETEVRTERDTCTARNEDGTEFTYPCEDIRTFDRRVPVAIDLRAEEAKLRSLEARIAEEERLLRPRIEACVAAHPE